MAQSGSVLLCPKGHASSEADYCSDCGAKIQGSEPVTGGSRDGVALSSAAELCPDCGTAREPGSSNFCEVCGYNFATGAHGEIPLAPAPMIQPEETREPEPESAPSVRHWTVEVSVDPALRAPESPEAPVEVTPFSIALTQPVSLIGRHNEARAILPEISLDHDEAVSRRHALLEMDAQGQSVILRDIGAANGTKLNGNPLQPMTDYPVKDGDEITLGHWSRLRLHAS